MRIDLVGVDFVRIDLVAPNPVDWLARPAKRMSMGAEETNTNFSTLNNLFIAFLLLGVATPGWFIRQCLAFVQQCSWWACQMID